MEREFFKDGTNSLLRFLCGLFSALMPSLLIPLCVGYHILGKSDTLAVDLHELLAGYVIGNMFYGFVWTKVLLSGI